MKDDLYKVILFFTIDIDFNERIKNYFKYPLISCWYSFATDLAAAAKSSPLDA